MGLDFQAFDIFEIVKTDAAPGALSQSGLQHAVLNAAIKTTGGTSEWTIVYTSYHVAGFSLQSSYYGCPIDLENAVVAAPTACDIAFTGSQQGENPDEKVQVAAQELAYEPTSSTAPQQVALGTFDSGFRKVRFVQVHYTLPGGSAALQNSLLFLVGITEYTACNK